MRLVLILPPSQIAFTDPTDDGPHPFLLGVSTLRSTARPGQSTGISSGDRGSLEVTLDNPNNHVALIIGSPLRVQATVYDDDDNLFFRGVVSRVHHGRVITLSLES